MLGANPGVDFCHVILSPSFHHRLSNVNKQRKHDSENARNVKSAQIKFGWQILSSQHLLKDYKVEHTGIRASSLLVPTTSAQINPHLERDYRWTYELSKHGRREGEKNKHETSSERKGCIAPNHLAREQRGRRGDVKRRVRTVQHYNIWSPSRAGRARWAWDDNYNNVVPYWWYAANISRQCRGATFTTNGIFSLSFCLLQLAILSRAILSPFFKAILFPSSDWKWSK